jgi:hypothetical protein
MLTVVCGAQQGPPRRGENIVSTTIRPLTFVVALLAGLLLALPAPARAADHQLTGTAAFNPPRPRPAPMLRRPTTTMPPS